MTPINGRFTFLGSMNIPTTIGNPTIQAAGGTTQIIVTASTGVNAIRTSPYVFLAGSATTYNWGTRIIDTKSPIQYSVTSMSWASNVLTLTHSAIPVSAVASQAGQEIHITNSSDPSKVPNGVYLTANSASQSTTQTFVVLNTDPVSLSGVTAQMQPGIIPTNGDNRGYYTINSPALANVTAAATAVYTPQIHSYTGQVFTTVVGTTASAMFGYVSFDGGRGRAAIPQGVPICIDQLQANKYFFTTGATNDANIISFYRPIQHGG